MVPNPSIQQVLQMRACGLYIALIFLQALQQPVCDAVFVAEEGDEAGGDAHDRRPRLPHLQRPLPRRQHPRGIRPGVIPLEAAHGDLKPGTAAISSIFCFDFHIIKCLDWIRGLLA